VSSLTTPGSAGRGVRVMNLHPIPDLIRLVPHSTKLKDIMGTSPPPTMGNGSEMCLSFLLKNGCWSNCRQAQHHTSTLSPNEQQRLHQYLTQRLTAAGLTQPTPSAPAVTQAP
jgi:hypothetical protein